MFLLLSGEAAGPEPGERVGRRHEAQTPPAEAWAAERGPQYVVGRARLAVRGRQGVVGRASAAAGVTSKPSAPRISAAADPSAAATMTRGGACTRTVVPSASFCGRESPSLRTWTS